MTSTPIITKRHKILAGIATCLAVANIIVSATVSHSGETLRRLELEARDLKHANQLLSQQVAATQSLTAIATRAEELGFVTKPGIVTLGVQEAIAQVPAVQ